MDINTTPAGSPSRLAGVGYNDETWDKPWNLARGQLTSAERMPSATLHPGGSAVPWPLGPQLDLSELMAFDPLTERSISLARLLRDRINNDAFLVVHNGKVVAETYANGMQEDDIHLVHSCTKTLTTMMVGIAFDEGRLAPSSPVTDTIPELSVVPGWEGVTVQHLLDMTAGIASDEHYEDTESMYWRYAKAVGYYGPKVNSGAPGVLGFVETELVGRVEEPGTFFNYASYLTNLLPILLERTYNQSAVKLYEQSLYRNLGAERPAVVNLDRFGRVIAEGQLSLTLRDFARWAWLYGNSGRNLYGASVLPAHWVEEAFQAEASRRAAFERSEYAALLPGAEYHNQAWLIDPSQGILAMLGIHGQFVFIDRGRNLMVVGLSSFPAQANALGFALLNEVLEVVTRAVCE